MAQWLEHRSYKAGVDGSIPSGRTFLKLKIFTFTPVIVNIKMVGKCGLVAQLVRALR